jgi:flagellar protein FlaJ
MIDQIKANIAKEKEILNYLLSIDQIKISPEEGEFYRNLNASLINQLNMLNSAIPELIKGIPEPEEKVVEQKEKEERVRRRIVTLSGNLSIDKKNREKYLQSLEIEEELLKDVKKRIGKIKSAKPSKQEYYKEVGGYTKLSNRIFSNTSINLAKSETFKPLSSSLKKANMPFLLSTYLSMALFGMLLAFIVMILLIPVIIITEIINPIYAIVGLIVVPIVVLIMFLVYPSSEASSLKGKVNDELPFAVMHMAAIAGSGIEPSRVFEILATSNEYPALRKEMMKIVNQINFYGYNLVSALRNTAKTTSSQRFADILNGIATTISSGGDLKEYLSKIASDTLLDYKLRRKRFTTISETYADIYTGLLVAAPLMFMLILVLMNVIGGGIGGMSTESLALIGIGVLVVVNIGFLVFLQVSQPES